MSTILTGFLPLVHLFFTFFRSFRNKDITKVNKGHLPILEISLACSVPRMTGTALDLCIVAIPMTRSPVYCCRSDLPADFPGACLFGAGRLDDG